MSMMCGLSGGCKGKRGLCGHEVGMIVMVGLVGLVYWLF